MKKALALALAVGTMLALAGCTTGETEPATNVTATSATLKGKGSCQAEDAGEWWFEYRPGTSGAWTAAPHHVYGAADCPAQNKPVSETVSGLAPFTQYQFRACTTDPVYWQGPACADKYGVSNAPDWETFKTKKLGGFMEGWFSRTSTDPNPGPGVDLPGKADALLNAAKNSGAQIARFNVSWCSLERTRDNFAAGAGAWNDTITQMKQIMKDPDGDPNTIPNGMRPLPILINAPTWARPPRNQPPADMTPQPGPCWQKNDNDNAYAPSDTYVAEWKEFVSAFIACMKNISCPPGVTKPGRDLERSDNGFLPIQGYEIWNEPNLNSYWGAANDSLTTDDADKFARMLRDSFDAANDRGSTRPVVLGGLAFPAGLSSPTSGGQWGFDDRNVAPVRYLNRIYNFFGDVPKFDAIGIHPYGNYFHTSAVDARQRYLDIKQVLVDRNDGKSQIWVTEIGDDGCQQRTWGDLACHPNDESLQSQRLVNMWTGDDTELPVPVIIYYRLMNKLDFDKGRPMGVLEKGDFLNPKLAYCALADQWGADPMICPS